jgi:hypothetical protein
MNFGLNRCDFYSWMAPAIRCGAVAAVVLISGVNQLRGATVYAIDINNASNPFTESGWTGLDAVQTGSDSTVVIDGITFQVFSADGARVRLSSGLPNPDSLMADFVFDDGDGQAVGLRFGSFAAQGTLAAGKWKVEMWIFDATTTVGTQIVGYQTHNSAGVSQGESIVSDAVEADNANPAITFELVADGTSFYSVFTRDNSATDRTRLNAVRITSLTAPQAGDFDGDGDVDGADFVAWQTNFPKGTGATLAEGDADSDGDVDGADFVVWQTNFPFTPGGGSSPVPEPQGLALAVMGLAAVGCLRRRGR